jgi:hypothetical protein
VDAFTEGAIPKRLNEPQRSRSILDNYAEEQYIDEAERRKLNEFKND